MDEEMKALGETAEATKEIAKTVRKAINASGSFGRFIATFISGPLEQGIGIFEDKLKYMRWERQLRLMKKAEELLNYIGLDAPTRPLPLKFAIPLFQAASMEEEDDLQDLWAQLLVNAGNIDSGVSLKRTYIDILESISSLEAHILNKIYSLPFAEMQHKGVTTADLPHQTRVACSDDKREPRLPNEEVELALANLARLGCIAQARTLGGGEFFGVVNPTLLGKSFIEACTIQRNRLQSNKANARAKVNPKPWDST